MGEVSSRSRFQLSVDSFQNLSTENWHLVIQLTPPIFVVKLGRYGRLSAYDYGI